VTGGILYGFALLNSIGWPYVITLVGGVLLILIGLIIRREAKAKGGLLNLCRRRKAGSGGKVKPTFSTPSDTGGGEIEEDPPTRRLGTGQKRPKTAGAKTLRFGEAMVGDERPGTSAGALPAGVRDVRLPQGRMPAAQADRGRIVASVDGAKPAPGERRDSLGRQG
jgi:hypothetical protein